MAETGIGGIGPAPPIEPDEGGQGGLVGDNVLIGTFVSNPPIEPQFANDPNLYRGPRILVPIDVQALVVEEEDAPLARKEVSSVPVDGVAEPAEPFTDGDPLPAGIHLHWAMPDALMHGTSEDPEEETSETISFTPDSAEIQLESDSADHLVNGGTPIGPGSSPPPGLPQIDQGVLPHQSQGVLAAAHSGEEQPLDSNLDEEKLSEMFDFPALPDRWVVYRIAPTPSNPDSRGMEQTLDWQIRGKMYTHHDSVSYLTDLNTGEQIPQYQNTRSLLRLDAHLPDASFGSDEYGNNPRPYMGWETKDIPFLRPGRKVTVGTDYGNHVGGDHNDGLNSFTHGQTLTVEAINDNEVLFSEPWPESFSGEEVWIYPGGLPLGSNGIPIYDGDGRTISTDNYPALVDAWIIESDKLTVTRLQDYDPNSGTAPSTLPPMTALGPNEDPLWTATYDNVKGRFTFHDNSFLPEMRGPFHYLVAGWYDNEEMDPLFAPIGSEKESWFNILDEFKWHIEQDDLANANFGNTLPEIGIMTKAQSMMQQDTIDNYWPRQSLFHGAVIDVAWKSCGGSFNREDIPLDAEFCMGNHPGECLATQIAKNFADYQGSVCTPEKEQQIETHLASFFMNHLDALNGPDGFYDLQQKIHGSTFKSIPAGHYYDFADQIEPVPGSPTQIVQYPSPRYYLPKTPCLSILNSRGSTRHGGDGIYTDTGELQCRWTGQCLTGSNAYGTDRTQAASGPRFVGFTPIPTNSIPNECTALFRELLLVSFTRESSFAWYNAARMIHSTGNYGYSNSGGNPVNFMLHFIAGGDDLLRQSLISFDLEGIFGTHGTPGTGMLGALIDGEQLSEYPGLLPSGFLPSYFDHICGGYSGGGSFYYYQPISNMSFSGGNLPSPVAYNLWSQAWIPVYLDYKMGYCHNVNHDDWSIDSEYSRDLSADMFMNSVDFEYEDTAPDPVFGDAEAVNYGNFPRVVRRTPLTRGSGLIAFDKLQRVLDEEADMDELDAGLLTGIDDGYPPGESDEEVLETLGDDLAWMDVLTATLSGYETLVNSLVGSEGMRGGHGRLEEAIIVDAFGRYQTLFLPGPDQEPHLLSLSMGHGQREYIGPDWSNPFLLRPRISQGARVMFRFMSSTDDDQPSNAASDGQTSPLCAFFVPDHVEWSMEVFDSNGDPRGQLRVAERDWSQGGVQCGRLAWDTVPGEPTGLGAQPNSGNSHSDALLNKLVEFGLEDEIDSQREEGVLSALLRAIDTTRWDIDRFGTGGNEHLATFIGHPIAVVRAKLWIELDERGDLPTPDDLLQRIFQIRVGALDKVSDGLVGYFVNDDYSRFHAVYRVDEFSGGVEPLTPDPNATDPNNPDIIPLTHPFLYFDPTLELKPGQEVTLTLLMNPLASIHAASGVVPQKEIKMTRNHFDAALSKIAPTFMFGPLLVDPASIRMPLPDHKAIEWSWGFKEDYSSWAEGPVEDADQSTLLRKGRLKAWDGWLKIDPIEDSD